MARVKGTAVASSLRYVRERFGEAALAQVLEGLAEEDRRVLEPGVLAASWYPMGLFLRFMYEAERQFVVQEPDLIRRMGRASAEYSVTTIYKIFLKVGTPEFILGQAAPVFGSYYDTGTMRVAERRSGHAVAELSGFAESAPQFCRRILGWMERTLELTGAKNVRCVHSLCLHRGDAVCRFDGDWE